MHKKTYKRDTKRHYKLASLKATRHLVPHPSQQRKLDKEGEDILMWETEHKKRRAKKIHKTTKENLQRHAHVGN